ncbi:hypothetical protein evm_005856 [Chilo suppressalis]|nr:hypothetical protein evm_005856 [Chilo suppressalis]
MVHIACPLLFILAFMVVTTLTVENKTSLPKSPAKLEKHNGAISSFVKMLIDIPMGIVEAFKDGADALESFVVSFMRGVF